MNVVDAFFVTFGLDSSGFEKGEKETRAATKRLREESKRTFDEMEQRGKKTGESFRNVRNEVVGLGLAFMGARSITGLIGGMMTGAAVADRLGQTMGMSAKQVWAWRMAMRGVGGQDGDADAALKTIQRDRMARLTGIGLDGQRMQTYSLLGINGDDLENSNPGAILAKIAKMQGKMDPQLFASLAGQLGLSDSMIYFFQQNKGSVDKLIQQYEQDGKKQEELAKQSEELQKSLVKLQTEVSSHLVPALVDLTKGINRLAGWMGGGDDPKPGSGSTWTPGGIPDPFGLYTFGSSPSGSGGAKSGNSPIDIANEMVRSILGGPGGQGGSGRKGGRRTRAERNNNPGNIEDGAFARSQPGYAGSDGRFAKFASVDAGTNAMEKLLLKYYAGGRDTIQSIIAKYAPASENNVSAYAAFVSKATGLSKNLRLSPGHIHSVAHAMAKHEGFRGNMHIGAITIHTKATDAKGIGRDLRTELSRRNAVSQADRGMMG